MAKGQESNDSTSGSLWSALRWWCIGVVVSGGLVATTVMGEESWKVERKQDPMTDYEFCRVSRQGVIIRPGGSPSIVWVGAVLTHIETDYFLTLLLRDPIAPSFHHELTGTGMRVDKGPFVPPREGR